LRFEPGRYIAGNSGILLTRVLYRKMGGEKKFVIVDAGMNDLIRPTLYESYHHIWPVKPDPANVPPQRSRAFEPKNGEIVDVVGPICESGDYLAKARPLPPTQRGDLLAVFTAGAYGFAMSSNYNNRPRAPEVLVDGNSYKIIRRRETLEDLVAAGTAVINSKLIAALQRRLNKEANPAKAPAMQAYMKSQMPYLGISTVPLRKICKEAFQQFALDSFEEFRDTILALWRNAKFREERYAAIELSGHKSYSKFQTLRMLPVYQEMITTGAWWDYVDPIAAHRLGPLLRRYPKQMEAKMRAWSKSKDLWQRRSAHHLPARLQRKH